MDLGKKRETLSGAIWRRKGSKMSWDLSLEMYFIYTQKRVISRHILHSENLYVLHIIHALTIRIIWIRAKRTSSHMNAGKLKTNFLKQFGAFKRTNQKPSSESRFFVNLKSILQHLLFSHWQAKFLFVFNQTKITSKLPENKKLDSIVLPYVKN